MNTVVVEEVADMIENNEGKLELDNRLSDDISDTDPRTDDDPLSLLISQDRDFLISPSGIKVKVSDLAGKVIALYFSANWYSPCRTFTKHLTKIYNELNECSSPSQLEVVLVSSDEDSNAFANYFYTMPWLSIPFSDLNSKKILTKKFNVEGIPCLVILQPNSNCKEEGAVIDGVEIMYRYGAEAFPYSRERLRELAEKEKEAHESQTLVKLLTNRDRDFLLGHPIPNRQNAHTLLSLVLHWMKYTGLQGFKIHRPTFHSMWTNGMKVPVSSLIGKTVGFYFSAQWCLPGVKFTTKLTSIYHKVKKELLAKQVNDEDFEIVLVSSDHNKEEFNSHFENMPWLALPFGDPEIKDLTKYFDIRGIPCLVIVGPDGKTVTKNGRNLVNLYKENAYPFTEYRVELLEREMDEVAKNLPRSEKHVGHRHELNLVSEGSGGGPFICCDCDEQGSGWAYQCIECGYEVHPRCVRTMGQGPSDNDD